MIAVADEIENFVVTTNAPQEYNDDESLQDIRVVFNIIGFRRWSPRSGV